MLCYRDEPEKSQPSVDAIGLPNVISFAGRHGPAMILVLYWQDLYRHGKKSTKMLPERHCWAFLN